MLACVPADRDCSRHAKTQAQLSGVDAEQSAPRKVSQRRKWLDRLKRPSPMPEASEAGDEVTAGNSALFCPILTRHEEVKKRGAAKDESAALQASAVADKAMLGRQRAPTQPEPASDNVAAGRLCVGAAIQGGTVPEREPEDRSGQAKHAAHDVSASSAPVPPEASTDVVLHSTDSICPVVEEDTVNEYIFTACSSGVVHQWAQDKQTQCDRFEVWLP